MKGEASKRDHVAKIQLGKSICVVSTQYSTRPRVETSIVATVTLLCGDFKSHKLSGSGCSVIGWPWLGPTATRLFVHRHGGVSAVVLC